MTVKQIGTFNINKIEVAEGQIEVHIPVEIFGDDFNNTLDKVYEHFTKQYPDATMPSFDSRLIWNFGTANSDFEVKIIMFDSDNPETVEFYNIGDIELTAEQSKRIKKAFWIKLGDELLNL